MTRVATLAQSAAMLARLISTQARVQARESQIASGKQAQTFAGVARNASRLVSLEGRHVRVSQYVVNNNLVDARLQPMDAAVDTVFQTVSDLRTLILQALNSATGDASPIVQEAEHLLEVVASALNTKHNSRYLFAGSKTSTPPVQVPVPNPTTFGVTDNNYYQGDSVILTIHVDDDVTLSYGMTADRAGFQQAIAALKAATQAGKTNDNELMETALDLANQALKALPGYRAEIGSLQGTLARLNDSHNAFLLYAENLIGDVENVDIPLAVTQLANDLTLLEASYLTLTRIASLTITRFLR